MRFLLALLFMPLLAQAEPATLIRATELKAKPASDAATVAKLAEASAVDAGERSGGWIRVKAQSGAEGWVKLLALRYGNTARRGDTGLQQAVNVARTGTSGTQVTTGVRGLDANDINTARPNAAEFEKLKGYSESKEGSSAFAQSGSLRAQKVEYPK